MTPRTLKTTLGDRPVTIQTGCETPLRHRFTVIETLTGGDAPRYGKLHDDLAVARLAHFTQQARAFGMVLSPAMRAKLRAHASLNLGNATSTCDVAGVETRVWRDMARTTLTWSNPQMRLIVTGIEQCNRAFPTDNLRFLDAVIDEVRAVTGRLYGAKTYARLIDAVPASMAVTRRPSLRTIQKAIERAQALAPATLPADKNVPAAPGLDVHSLRRAVGPVVRDAIGPLHALLTQLLATGSSPDSVVGGVPSNEQALQARLPQTSLEDAHARMRRLEE